MSRGLGQQQRLILQAIRALEVERGETGRSYYVWAILKQAYALSAPLQRLQAEQDAHLAEHRAEMQQQWEAGDALAGKILLLGDTIRSLKPRNPGRVRRKGTVRRVEDINPSRILASLAKRGLVHRYNVQGGGSAGLTDAGRQAIV